MPGVVRKFIIFANSNGLILQPHGGADHRDALQIDFKSSSIVSCEKVEPETFKQSPYLETYGIIGLLTVASFSFLLCITRREQVAQIFGKPVYVIKDVAILPLSSQTEADQVIIQTRAGLQVAKASQESDTHASASEESGYESYEDHSLGDPSESRTPGDGRPQIAVRGESTTSVVQDVIERKGQYSRFASQWFSRRGWGSEKKRTVEKSVEMVPETKHDGQKPPSEVPTSTPEDVLLPVSSEKPHHHNGSGGSTTNQRSSHEAVVEMLPKILRTVKLLLTSRSFYFSYDFNVTKKFGSSPIASLKSVSSEVFDQQYFWNQQLITPFSKAGFSSSIMPIMQGFVGQRPFIVNNGVEEMTHTEAFESSQKVLKAEEAESGPNQSPHRSNGPRAFLLTLISRRSVKRSGLRYLRRGVDDEGNCANSVETEQVLSSPTWEETDKIRSFVQFRASIPLFFSQSPYAFKPVPILHQSPEVNRKAFDRHFEEMRRRYGTVHVVLLVDKQGGEKRIGEVYENLSKSSNGAEGVQGLGFNWFDFHNECRGMKFENVQKLVDLLGDTMNSFGETVIDGQTTNQTQTGIMRTNCMDCLDRTNVVQSAFAQKMLQKDLEQDGLEIDFVHDPSTQWFNTLWADNGDAISRQYASTAALKGDYTRTRKRNYRGALNDFGLTLTRYYNNIVNDYFSQTVIDVLLGNVAPRIFEDFEATMMSADPGISIDKLRQNAIDTCSQIVIQLPEENLLHGWAMTTPAQANTLRTLPFEEAVLLLTDHAVYGCKFDWNTEKVASFERIDLRSITKLHYGTYITSTLTEGQIDEDLNVGLVVSYEPGKESIKRVNTRSLQISTDGQATDGQATDGQVTDKSEDKGDSAILSWLRTRSSATLQCMAMKVIPNRSLVDEKTDSCPLATAERICNEIQRAIIDSFGNGKEHETDLIEKTDIISLADARSRTGYLEQIGHSIKKLVWT